ncbi:MAG: hypothetical protein JWR80_3002 [Bradyrhizobium sp.]|nr:hypothetical protein [Bradyrhizobium sp.]
MISEHGFLLRERDGIALAVRRWSAVGTARALMVVAHGMGEHSARYLAPLTPLIADGVTVYALDHRGHGASVADGGTFGDYGRGGYAGLVSDLAALVEQARRENPGVPVVLFGHSMGSMIAQGYALEFSDRIDALILCGSAAVDVVAIAGAADPAIFGALNRPFEPARTPFDWLSRDEAEVDAYIADPWCGFGLVPESFTDLFGQGAKLADPARLADIRKDLPVYIFSGDRDPLHCMLQAVDPLVARYRAAGLAVTFRLYPGGRHEVLNETNRSEVVGDLISWSEGILPKVTA